MTICLSILQNGLLTVPIASPCLCPRLSSHFNIKSNLIAEFAACLQYDPSILTFQFVHLVAHVFEFSENPFWAESFAVHSGNCICLETEQHAESKNLYFHLYRSHAGTATLECHHA